MARSTFRRRGDGIHEIVGRGRAPLLLAGGTLLAALVLLTAATTAFALRLVLALPVLVGAGALFAVRLFRRPRRAASAAAAPAAGAALRVIEGGLRGPAASRPTPAGAPLAARRPASDAGA